MAKSHHRGRDGQPQARTSPLFSLMCGTSFSYPDIGTLVVPSLIKKKTTGARGVTCPSLPAAQTLLTPPFTCHKSVDIADKLHAFLSLSSDIQRF